MPSPELTHDPQDDRLQSDDLTTPEWYPALNNLSAGHLFRRTLRATDPTDVEYVTVTQRRVKDQVAIAQWNMHWEAAQFRRYLFDEDDLPAWMAKIADQGEQNVMFLPRTDSRYYELAPLYHLLSKATIERHGLPVISRGIWPVLIGNGVEDILPDDTPSRLAKAWGSTIWRHLMPGSRMLGFTKDDPIRLLAHNLDFWIPPVTQVIQQRLNELPQSPRGKKPVDKPALLEDGSALSGARITRPRMGSPIWVGEDDAQQARLDVIEAADQTGSLRGILDAVRSNRIEDDFSNYWTYAKEDFERKLHHKRVKAKVTFVELTHAPPLHGPETEVIGNVTCNDFLAILSPQDRRIVILLASGHSKLTDIAQILGYANHSPVSKRLAAIRKVAAKMLAD